MKNAKNECDLTTIEARTLRRNQKDVSKIYYGYDEAGKNIFIKRILIL